MQKAFVESLESGTGLDAIDHSLDRLAMVYRLIALGLCLFVIGVDVLADRLDQLPHVASGDGPHFGQFIGAWVFTLAMIWPISICFGVYRRLYRREKREEILLGPWLAFFPAMYLVGVLSGIALLVIGLGTLILGIATTLVVQKAKARFT